MSLGLVSYGSSDEGSSEEEQDNQQESTVIIPTKSKSTNNSIEGKLKLLNLPAPKSEVAEEGFINLKLPAPQAVTGTDVIEEDDEFLKKKELVTVKPPPLKKAPVRIVLPSLSEYKEDKEITKKPTATAPPKKTSLFSLLPKPKSEMTFTVTASSSTTALPAKHSNLIPHSVRNPKPKAPEITKKPAKPTKVSLVQKYSDSESSDDDQQVDFFSLNSKQSLPEVSANEIQKMIAQKAAQMSAAAEKVNEMTREPEITDADNFTTDQVTASNSNSLELDAVALEQLCGTRYAKRQKLQEMEIIDISMSEIIQSKEEFLRQQMQNETQFVPTGRLVGNDMDEKSKKKHHITYLAHKAKANEAELQAMWSANRYSRQQTQSKYGF